LNIEERFANSYRVAESGCWEWTAGKCNGYGRIKFSGHTLAHRVAWIMRHGEIPDGMLVCHRCDNPGCVNPDHLFLGDHAANMADMAKKKRAGRRAPQSGELNRIAKLTQDDVDFIRFAFATMPMVQKEVARAFGVTPSNISALMRNKSWVGAATT
jgi:hypothetical protein